jgi:protein ImuB
VAASGLARAEGVRPGQRRREAQALCTYLAVHERDRDVEARAFDRVVDALDALGAPVSVRLPGWAALATRGPARYLGGETALVAAVDEALARLAFPGTWWRAGVSDGAFVATQAALRGLVVPPGRGAELLAPLGVDVLDHPELAGVLVRLGITTLGAFASLGEPDVLARFGMDGARAHRQARGLEDEPLHARPRREDLSVTVSLDPPAEAVEATAFVARALAEQLAARLSSKGLACTRLRVEATTTDGERLVRVWSGADATSAVVVAERLRWQLEAWLLDRAGSLPAWETGEVPAGQGVERVTLVPEEILEEGAGQLDLWSRPRVDEERMARAATRVQGILGMASVVRPELSGGRGPGERVRLVAFGGLVARDVASEGRLAPWPGRLPAPSPTVVAAAPLPVDLLDAGGRQIAVDARGEMSGSPAAILLGGAKVSPVVAWAGPWPADERWWEGPVRRRRVRVQVVTARGDAYLLVREKGTWFLEGAYG